MTMIHREDLPGRQVRLTISVDTESWQQALADDLFGFVGDLINAAAQGVLRHGAPVPLLEGEVLGLHALLGQVLGHTAHAVDKLCINCLVAKEDCAKVIGDIA